MRDNLGSLFDHEPVGGVVERLVQFGLELRRGGGVKNAGEQPLYGSMVAGGGMLHRGPRQCGRLIRCREIRG